VSTLGLIVVFTALSGFLSALAASVFLALDRPAGRDPAAPGELRHGALLGAAFLGLLPHALDQLGDDGAHAIGSRCCWASSRSSCSRSSCSGAIATMTRARCTRRATRARDAASAKLILAGDAFHNVLDGVLVAAAFMTDTRLAS